MKNIKIGAPKKTNLLAAAISEGFVDFIVIGDSDYEPLPVFHVEQELIDPHALDESISALGELLHG
jgi:hypothetical protein